MAIPELPHWAGITKPYMCMQELASPVLYDDPGFSRRERHKF
jgi:hypothetical protein